MTAALERPVWDALHGRLAGFTLGDARARRFMPEVGSFASARDDEPDSLAALAALVPPTGTLLLLQAPAIVLPPGTVTVTAATGVQMIAERAIAAPTDPRTAQIERLGAAASPEMVALAQLTKPGPFGPRTHEVGEFWGIRDRGALIAMAGERLGHAGFTEVSGVCTHPDARGRGLARLLSAWVASRIAARGDTPYLHAYATNTAAIELYRSLGFAVSRSVNVMAIARANSPAR
jgi:predicted GNAT family acetyltransferase